MCELFGASLKEQSDLRNYLKKFYSHSVHHPHGWGLMRKKYGKTQIIKEAVCANESLVLNDIIENTPPQNALLAHIRYATVGATKPENCHPFSAVDNSGRQWTMIHNGTIYSGVEIMKYSKFQKGNTDSERVFLYLLECINAEIKEKGTLNEHDRFNIFENLVKQLAPRNKLNLMIYDDEILYVHKNMSKTLSYLKTKKGIIISTLPLDENGWASLPLCRPFAFKDGEMLFEGQKHNNEFIPALDYITIFDAMNI